MQYVMRNLGANSVRPLVDKFTNFMVGMTPLVIERLLPHSKSMPHRRKGLIFLPQNFAQLILDLCHSKVTARNK